MTIDARLQKMSMYSALLGASLESVTVDQVGGPTLESALLRELARCRRNLVSVGAPSAGAPSDAPRDIARQIDYDLALIRLCRLHGIECDPARFTRPEAERQRLEAALGECGVDLSAPVPGARLGPGQDPPEGSAFP